MNETLLTMLQSIIILAVVLLTAYVVRYISTKTKQAQNAVANDTAKRYIKEASDAVCDAVLATSQIYVDNLKKKDKFDKQTQREALQKAVDMARSQLTKEAEDFIQSAYGDVTLYLTTKIEAEIKAAAGGVT